MLLKRPWVCTVWPTNLSERSTSQLAEHWTKKTSRLTRMRGKQFPKQCSLRFLPCGVACCCWWHISLFLHVKWQKKLRNGHAEMQELCQAGAAKNRSDPWYCFRLTLLQRRSFGKQYFGTKIRQESFIVVFFSTATWISLVRLRVASIMPTSAELLTRSKEGSLALPAKSFRSCRTRICKVDSPHVLVKQAHCWRITLRFMLSDLDSIRYATCLGLQGKCRYCCVFCKNYIKRDTQIPDYNAYFKDISTPDFRLFDLQSETEIFEVIDQLVNIAGGLSKSALQKKETAMGFNYNPDGLLSDRLAREALPPSAFLLDTMHLYFSNSIWSWEMNRMYNAWAQTGAGDLPGFLDLDWKTSLLPVCSASSRKRLADEYMFIGNSYKGSALNLMAFFPCFDLLVFVGEGDGQLQGLEKEYNRITTDSTLPRISFGWQATGTSKHPPRVVDQSVVIQICEA